jgi:hypothetical protein
VIRDGTAVTVAHTGPIEAVTDTGAGVFDIRKSTGTVTYAHPNCESRAKNSGSGFGNFFVLMSCRAIGMRSACTSVWGTSTYWGFSSGQYFA